MQFTRFDLKRRRQLRLLIKSINVLRNEPFRRITTQGLSALLACETQNKNNGTDFGNAK